MGTLLQIVTTFAASFAICYGIWKVLIKIPKLKKLEFGKFAIVYYVGPIVTLILILLILMSPAFGSIVATLVIGRFLFYLIETYLTYSPKDKK